MTDEMKKKFVAIGHITNDTEPTDHLGGGVSYTAVAAARLGYEAHIITKCPPGHPYIQQLHELGITVHVLPSQKETITTFQIHYQTVNKRLMRVPFQQEIITKDDFAFFPKDILQNACILIATVLGEVDTALFPLLATYGQVSLSSQGYFRYIAKDTTVEQRSWIGPAKDMQALSSIIFSQEDITMQGEINHKLLEQFRELVPITVMTQGDHGCTVYTEERTFSIPAISLSPEETKDLTGAGEVYTVSFLIFLREAHDLKQAATLACMYAALKIMGRDGLGMDSIPTREQFEEYRIKSGQAF